MKAYKCDRCGKFYSRLPKYANEPWIFVTSSCTSTSSTYIKDLCDNCQKELEAWWMMENADKEIEDEQVLSQWIDVPLDRYMLLHRCSNCLHCFDRVSNYCPNCGKKMAVKNEDKETADDSKRT